MPATLTVNSLSDAFSPGAGQVTLREAITASEYGTTTALNETGTGNDTIVFAPGLAGTIDLQGTLGSYNNDQLTIDGNNGGTGITIERDSSISNMQLFYVSTGASLTLRSLTLSNGHIVGEPGYADSTYGGEGGGAAGLGGGIFNQGTLCLVQDTLAGNTAQGGAGGATGDSFGSYNGAPGGGVSYGYGGAPGYGAPPGNGGAGGFASGGGGGGTADYPANPGGTGGAGGFGGGGGGGGSGTPNANGGAGGFGGGAGAESTGSATPGGGGAGMGGAVFNDAGTVTVTNCTFFGNSAVGGAAGGTGAFDGLGLGGAIFNYNGTMTVLNSTFSGNSADNAGGVYSVADGATATLNLYNTILFGDTSAGTADLVAGTSGASSSTNVTSGVGNLIGGSSGFSGSIVNTGDPGLAALAANGGPTESMAIDTTSPAAGTGDTMAAAGLTTDQRGASRFTGGVDIGAYQINVAPTASAGGPYQIHVGGQLALNAPASIYPGDLPLTYSWDINGDGTFGDATGISPTLTWGQLNALGITGTFSTANVSVEVTDGFFRPVASTATTLDVVPATVLTANDRFITALYHLLLHRAPDAAGLAAWSALLDAGLSRAQLALYIKHSSEYLADEVNSAFERYLRRSADQADLSAFVAMLGQGLTLEELDVAILSSEEYFETQGASTNYGFLNALFQDTLGRPIDGASAQFFGGLLSTRVSRDAIVLSVLTSVEYRQDLVNGMYQEYLLRSADSSGLNGALAQLERGESPTVLAAEILGSAEYFEDVTST